MLSNRDKSQHDKDRGLDGRETEELRDHAMNQLDDGKVRRRRIGQRRSEKLPTACGCDMGPNERANPWFRASNLDCAGIRKQTGM